ncbi:sensor histidine kinase [Microbacterium istanbulense]|uniref:histidine kinase n=1 Tax=Microbacterium istanbulense TaxID=3122049 RepID=A0ABU8LH89_9MICO
MAHIHPARRAGTELLAAAAAPFALLAVVALPLSAAVIAELDRWRARLCGAEVTPLRPAALPWGRWMLVRARTAAVWRTDVPVYLAGIVLGALVLLLSFFGIIGAVVLLFSPLFWMFGIAAQVGAFTPTSLAESWWAVPAGVVLGALTVALLVGGSLLRDAVLRGFSARRDPDLLAKIDELRTSRASLTAAFEGERQRIERDLHDGAQQDLVAVVMRVGLVEASAAARGDERLEAQAREAREHAERALQRLRETVRGIHPRELSDLGLIAAVRELVARSPLPVDLVAEGDDAPLSSPTAAAMYFTVSEALTNIVKHAGATRARISLLCSTSQVRLTVQDDGEGGARIDTGSGLAGLRERMRSVGGDLDVHDAAGGGTEVVATAPSQPPW